jgi:hypothetical protein
MNSNKHKQALLLKEVINFLYKNPFPSEDTISDLIDESSYSATEIVEMIASVATLFVRFYRGGLSNKLNVKESDVDPKQLKMGIEVEYEHTPDSSVSKKIALDHLAEIPDYYTRLAKMEAEAESK